jgi:hypothetical protein
MNTLVVLASNQHDDFDQPAVGISKKEPRFDRLTR